MRSLSALAAVLVLGSSALVGCGKSFPLPTESRVGRSFSLDKSYKMVATWSWTGTETIADILLTQGSGSQLFLLFQAPGPGVGTSPRGRVEGYALKAVGPNPMPLAIRFLNLFNPHALCSSINTVFVLDQGDTCLARFDPATGLCYDPTREWSNEITDFSKYWRVREYGLLGKDTISTFTDTTLAFVRGVAADDRGRVYVSGSAYVLLPDQVDPRNLTRTFQSRIYRYLKVTPGSVPPDPRMPGTNRWIRDDSYVVEEGSGLGFVQQPRGLYWGGAGAVGGPGLFAADSGTGWVQKLSDVTSSTGLYRIDTDITSTLNGPTDVAVDLAGFVYLTDTGNRRVLRFDAFGGDTAQRVDVELDADHQSLQEPLAVAANEVTVYVGDRVTNKVVRYERRP